MNVFDGLDIVEAIWKPAWRVIVIGGLIAMAFNQSFAGWVLRAAQQKEQAMAAPFVAAYRQQLQRQIQAQSHP